MRNFLLAGAAAYSAALSIPVVAAGAVGVFRKVDGIDTISDGADIVDMADLVLGRTSALGGPVILPIHKLNFSYVKSVYVAGTQFVGTFTVPTPATKGTYSLILAKKGVLFNERSNYTASTYVSTDGGLTAAQLAQKLVTQINAGTANHGATATLAGAVITITGSQFIDYAIIGADKLMGIDPTYTTTGKPALNDAKYIKDLANKAAADRGFNYTWSDDRDLLYPNYDVDPLAQPSATDVGYTVFTLRFAVPRKVKTVDEVVNQIVQVAYPTGSAGIAGFETVLEGITTGVSVPET